MDKIILNGNKERFYSQGNTQSGSIQYTQSKLKISASSGVTITHGLLHLGTENNTSSLWNDQSVICSDNKLNINNHITSSALRVNGSIAHGIGVITSGNYSHAEGADTIASGQSSHAQGTGAIAGGNYSHAQGINTIAAGPYSHAQGAETYANGDCSHAQGSDTIASGQSSHAQGAGAIASGDGSHAQGLGTTTSIDYQHATGKYNAVDNNAIFIVGTGSSVESRANGFWVTLTGQANAGLGFSSSGYLKVGTDITVGNDISSPTYLSGFGGQGFRIDKSGNRYIAQFDDLWVRGSMNVYQLVINQIRATNGSLWVSDAGKTTGAVISATNVVLGFQTSSYIPFLPKDIIRTKRWGTSGSTTTSVWDITSIVSSVNYNDRTLTFATSSAATSSGIGTWAQIVAKLNNSGSDWVRVGNENTASRQGAIYLTSNDIGGPFLDVIDSVSSVALATNGPSGNVSSSKVKVRLGRLTGIVDSTFQPAALTGYGLYSDNAFLKGTVSAKAGDIAGWKLDSQRIYKQTLGHTFSITNSAAGAGLFVYSNGNTPTWSNSGTKIYLGSDGRFSLGNMLTFDNGSLTISGVQAELLEVGGWLIAGNSLWSNGITLSSANSPENPSIAIGLASAYNSGRGIFMSGSAGTSYLRVGNPTNANLPYLLWDDTNLTIKTSNFTLSNGSITAQSAVISGSISSSAGQIGGWTIDQNTLNQNNQIVLGSSSAIGADDIFLGSKDGLAYFQLGSKFKYTNSTVIMTGSIFATQGVFSGSVYANSGTFNGTVNANAGVFSGSILANTGYIGGTSGWTINTNVITNSNGIQISASSTPAIKIGASGYGENGIWLGKGNYYSASFWNKTAERGLKWDGQNLLISASNFKLNSSGNISASNATFSGYVSASSGYFGGNVTANAGKIGGWTIGTNKIYSGIITLSSDTSAGNYPYIGIGASDKAGYGIYLGTESNKPYLSLRSENNTSFLYNGTELSISTSNFTLSFGGDMYAKGGQIGGWNIHNGDLSSSVIKLSSGASPYIGISTSNYNEPGIWFGIDQNISKFSINSATTPKYFRWTGEELQIFGTVITTSFGVITPQVVFRQSGSIRSEGGKLTISGSSTDGGGVRFQSGKTYYKQDAIYHTISIANGWFTMSAPTIIKDTFSVISSGKKASFWINSAGDLVTDKNITASNIGLGAGGGGLSEAEANTKYMSKSDWVASKSWIESTYATTTSVTGSLNFTLSNFLTIANAISDYATKTNLNNTKSWVQSNYFTKSGGTMSNVEITGSINVNKGYIGGFTISSQNLAKDDNSFVLGSYQTIGANDFFVGTQNGAPRFQLGDRAKFTNSAFSVKADTWSIIKGTTTASFWLDSSGNLQVDQALTASKGFGNVYSKAQAENKFTSQSWTNYTMSLYSASVKSSFDYTMSYMSTSVIKGALDSTMSNYSNSVLTKFGGYSTTIQMNDALALKINRSGGKFNGAVTTSHLKLGNHEVDSIYFDEDSGILQLNGNTKIGGSDPSKNYISSSGEICFDRVTASNFSASTLKLGTNQIRSGTTYGIETGKFQIKNLYIETLSAYNDDSSQGTMKYFLIDNTSICQARVSINSQSALTYTVSNAMVGQYNRISNSANITVCINTQSQTVANYKIQTGSVITLFQTGDGTIQITKEAAVTLNSYNGGTKTYGLNSSIQLINVQHNIWDLIGAV